MKEKLIFYSLLDFYIKKEKIKEIYKSLTLEDIKLYKKYVYSTCFEREYVKDLIWEYLNDWEPSYERLDHEYYLKRRKLKNDIVEDNIAINNNNLIDKNSNRNI